MPITTRRPATPTRLQNFRSLTEGYLVQVAQRDMLQKYSAGGTAPVPKRGLIYRLLPVFFLPGFRLTPWAIRQRILSLFFVHKTQHWPEQTWDQPGE
ncbi:MAG: hypothetical protein NVS4B8_21420 [Herpetosiphon sp.]